MSPVELRPRPAPSTRSTLHLPIWVAGVGTVVLAFALAASARLPAAVDRIDVVNPTSYELSVDVRGADGGGWVPLGYAARDHTTTVREVLDQGERWTFRFEGQGRDGGRIDVTRAQLARDGWRLRVTPEVEDRLRAAGAPPSP